MKVAADVNDDKTLNAQDINELRSLILGNIESFTSNDSWRFVSSETLFNDEQPFNNRVQNYVETVQFNPLTRDDRDVNFTAVKIGDLNNTVRLSRSNGAEIRSSSGNTIIIKDEGFESGDTLEVRFDAEQLELVTSLLVELNIGPELKYVDFVSSDLPDFDQSGLGEGLLDQNKLIVLWLDESLNGVDIPDGANLFTLRFVAVEEGSLSESLALTEMFRDNELTNVDSEVIDIDLTFDIASAVDQVVPVDELIVKVIPSPFSEVAKMSIEGDFSGPIRLEVYSTDGRILMSSVQPNGTNEFVLTNDKLGGYRGVLVYRIETGSTVVSGKMIRL